MSDETFVRELERRADDVQPRFLQFEDVRRSAHRIRRRHRRSVRLAHSHAAQPQRRDFEAACSECALLHCMFPS